MARTPFLRSTRLRHGSLAPAMAGVLMASLLVPPDGLAVTPAVRHRPAARKSGTEQKLTSEQKTLHALNRLTFGPRPGEVAAVTRQGLDAVVQRAAAS